MPVYHGGNKHKGRGFSDKHQRKLTEITCTACGKSAKVNYKPIADKKQYCKPCYVRL